jgi:hypothetical protein
MDIDNLSGLPEWCDDEFNNDDTEKWKPNPTKDAAKAMYEQWRQVMVILRGALETSEDDDRLEVIENKEDFLRSFRDEQKGIIMNDAFEVAIKIQSSESGMYMIRMENASIIRKNAQNIYTAMLGLMSEKSIDEAHGNVIRAEIDKFRLLFRHWVTTFKKDAFVDDWGLFN